MELSKKKQTTVLLILSAIAGLVYLTPFLRFSFYDQMSTALGLTDRQMGVIGGVYGALNVISYVPSGFLTERMNTKRLLLISMFGMCATTIWYSLYPPFWALVIIHGLYGVFSVGTFWCAYLKSVRSLAPESGQGTIFGLSEGLRGVAQTAVAFLCLGALGIFATYAAGFRAVILINAAVFALLFFAVLFLVPDFDKDAHKTADGKPEPVSETLRHIFMGIRNPSNWLCIGIVMCGYALWNTVNGFIGTYCTRVLHISESLSSTLSILRSYIIVFVAGTTGGVFLDRFRTKGQGMMIFFLMCGLAALGLFLTESLVVVCVVISILTAYFTNCIKSTYWSILGDAGIPAEATGSATGLISLIALTPDFFTPPIISRFIDSADRAGHIETGFHMMLFWMMAWAALGIFFSLLLKRKKLYSAA